VPGTPEGPRARGSPPQRHAERIVAWRLSPCTSHVERHDQQDYPDVHGDVLQSSVPVARGEGQAQITMSAPSSTPPARPASRPAQGVPYRAPGHEVTVYKASGRHYGRSCRAVGFSPVEAGWAPNYRKPPVRHRGCHDRDPRTHQTVRGYHRRLGPDVRRPARYGHRFLGPNGAGKSTTMRISSGWTSDQRLGSRHNGRRPGRTPRRCTRSAACWTRGRCNPSRSAYHHLLALAQTPAVRRSRVDEVIDAVGLRSWRGGRPASSPSHGRRARHRRRAARRPGHRGPGRAGQRA